jgi:hypothetical protein
LSTALGSAFELGVIQAAGFQALNIEPGSLRIRDLESPDVTVRLTLIATVPRTVINGLASGLFPPPPPVVPPVEPPAQPAGETPAEPPVVEGQ